jgi:hypothetical protein
MSAWKWIALTCPECGKAVPPTVGPLDKPDSIISPYSCWECEHPEEAEAMRQAWIDGDKRLDEMVLRGEIKDAEGNPVPFIRVIT